MKLHFEDEIKRLLYSMNLVPLNNEIIEEEVKSVNVDYDELLNLKEK